MGAALSTQLLIASLSLLLLSLGGLQTARRKLGLVILFVLILLADNLILIITNGLRPLQLVPNRSWGGFLVLLWSGKFYSIILMLMLAFVLRPILSSGEIGLRIQLKAGSICPSLIAVLLLVIWSLWIAAFAPKGLFDFETLMYLATMPGLNEELTYRGLLLGIANQVFPARRQILGARLGSGVVVTALVFGLVHGVWMEEGMGLQVNLIALRNAALSGLIFAWLKERTASLVMPILAHGAQDVLLFVPRML